MICAAVFLAGLIGFGCDDAGADAGFGYDPDAVDPIITLLLLSELLKL